MFWSIVDEENERIIIVILSVHIAEESESTQSALNTWFQDISLLLEFYVKKRGYQ